MVVKQPPGGKPGCNGKPANGHITVAGLAEAKRLPPGLLEKLGVHDLPGGGVGIPYFGLDGYELFVRKRDTPGGPRFRQPAGVPLSPYGLNHLDAARRHGRLYATEGESDAWALLADELPALGLPGNGAAKALEAEYLAHIHDLYILADNDDAGDAFVAGVLKRLGALGFPGRVWRLRVPPAHKDVSDWRAAAPERFADELAEATQSAERLDLAAGGEDRPSRGEATARLATTCLAEIRPQPLRWFVPGYLPLGKVVLLAGDGGHGKSCLTLHMVACLTRGRPCLGLRYANPLEGEALVISCEDDYADTVVPRLLAAGADLSRVHRVDGVLGPDGKPQPFSMAHYEALEAELKARPTVRLVTIDPAGAYIGRSGIDDHKDADLRALLDPMAELAAARAVTVTLVKHLVKGVTAKAIHKVSGSAGYVNAVRAAFVVAPEKDGERKLFLPLKFNLGPHPAGLAYRLVELAEDAKQVILDKGAGHLGPEDRARLGEQLYRVEWEGVVDATADGVFAEAARQDRGPRKVEQAMVWLKDFLGPCAYPSEEITAAGKAAGFTFDNLKEAKAALAAEGLRSTNRGKFQGAWWSGFGDPEGWKLRPVPTPPQTPHSPHTGETQGKHAGPSPIVGSQGEGQTPHNGGDPSEKPLGSPIVGRVGSLGSEQEAACEPPGLQFGDPGYSPF
jgi:hypothetical protein